MIEFLKIFILSNFIIFILFCIINHTFSENNNFINMISCLIAIFFPLYFFSQYFYNLSDIYLYFIYYLALSIIHIIFLAVMERSVAISILQVIKNRKNTLSISELKKIININYLVRLRLKNLIRNNLILKNKKKIMLTKFGYFFYKLIILSKKIFV